VSEDLGVGVRKVVRARRLGDLSVGRLSQPAGARAAPARRPGPAPRPPRPSPVPPRRVSTTNRPVGAVVSGDSGVGVRNVVRARRMGDLSVGRPPRPAPRAPPPGRRSGDLGVGRPPRPAPPASREHHKSACRCGGERGVGGGGAKSGAGATLGAAGGGNR